MRSLHTPRCRAPLAIGPTPCWLLLLLLPLLVAVLLPANPVIALKTSGYVVYAPTPMFSIAAPGFLPAPTALHYNHDSSIALVNTTTNTNTTLLVVLWNANAQPSEGKRGQLNYMATAPLPSSAADPPAWSAPAVAFPDIPCTLDAHCTQWQPNLLLARRVDGSGQVLICTWSQSSEAPNETATFVSVAELQGDALRWRTLARLSNFAFNNQSWHAFPTQNPLQLSDGSVLAPVTLISTAGNTLDAVLMAAGPTADKWQLSQPTMLPNQPRAQWEPSVSQPAAADPAALLMLARNNLAMSSGQVANSTRRLVYSTSRDRGQSWSELAFVPVETICSRCQLLGHPLAGPDPAATRGLMVLNDFPMADGSLTDRRNIALWTRLGTQTPFAFAPGPSITTRFPVVAYPQFVASPAGTEAFMSFSQGESFRSIRVARFPLPPAGHPLVMPRGNRLSLDARPALMSAGAASAGADAALQLLGGQYLDAKSGGGGGGSGQLLGRAFSVAGWIHALDGPGVVLVDSRSAAAVTETEAAFAARMNETAGLVFGLDFWNQTQLVPFLNLEGPHNAYASKLRVPTGQWVFVGVSALCLPNGTLIATFAVNDAIGRAVAPGLCHAGAEYAVAGARLGAPGSTASSLRNYTGLVHMLAVFPQAVSMQELWAYGNSYAAAVHQPRLPAGNATQPPTPPAYLFDAASASLDKDFAWPPPLADNVTEVGGDLRVCGMASASIELPPNAPQSGDRLVLNVTAEWEAEGLRVLATVGSGDHPVRLVLFENSTLALVGGVGGRGGVGLCLGAARSPLAVSLVVEKTRVSASVGSASCSLNLWGQGLVARWAFLGNGYTMDWSSQHWPLAGCFSIPVASIAAEVYN